MTSTAPFRRNSSKTVPAFERSITGPLLPNSDIPRQMWFVAFLICMSGVSYGYALVSLNTCLVLGSRNSMSACYNGDDDSSPGCPKGSIFDDLDLDSCKE